MPFNRILGQQAAVDYLKNIARSGNTPGAMLFHGLDGVGKSFSAKEFAKSLNCLDPQARAEGDNCGICRNCLDIDRGLHPDVVFVDFEYQTRLELKRDPTDKKYQEEFEKELAKQQHIKVDTIRHVTNKSEQKSIAGGYKVLMINQAQTMQASAANALLKYIEEPPHKTIWILITDKKASMLQTILSRCQPLAFVPLEDQTLKQILQERDEPLANLDLAARYSGGSVTGALKADEALSVLKSAPQGPGWPYAVASSLSRAAAVSRQEVKSILDVIAVAVHRSWREETDKEKMKQLQDALLKIEDYKRSINRNVSPALIAETALMGLDKLKISIF